jgi:hypothetical protein
VKVFLPGLVLVASATLGACAKKNDVATLRHEAVTVAKYYAPKLDALDARVQTIFKRGSTIPANLPGIDAVGAKLTEARDMIIQLRGIVAPGADGKSAVEKQADAAAKDHKHEDLEKLLHDTHTTLERGITVINDDLQTVEGWIAQYDNKALAMAPVRRAPPEMPPPAQPVTDGAAQPAPGAAQPAPGAAQPAPGAAQPAPGAAQPAPGRAQPAPGAAQPARPAPAPARP